MSVESNKAVVRRLFEAINAQDTDTLDEVLSPALAQEFKHNILPWLNSTFAGHRFTVRDLIAEGDKVVAQFTTQGVHTGEWHGVTPTHKAWVTTGIYVLRLEQGKVVAIEGVMDDLKVASQIGASLALASSRTA
jgi:predicted ester cyclase